MDKKFAWKNIEYWWSNKHYNPDGSETKWIPRSKKIWFTEFGFPSIDKATNQPNIFFDPKSIEGGAPRYSSGEVDFALQRRAIKIAIEYFKTCFYLENYFLWTWDARPYPSWPHMNIWRDGYLWDKGHWVNNKLTSISLASLVQALCRKAKIDLNKVNVLTLYDPIEGIIFDKDISIMDAINILRTTYLFDIDSSYKNIINFVKRGYNNNIYYIPSSDFSIQDSFISKANNISDLIKLSELHLSYLESNNDYRKAFFKKSIDNLQNYNKIAVKIPIVLSISEVKKVADILLHHSNYESKEFEFCLPIFYKQILPTDLVIIKDDKNKLRIRVISLKISDFTIRYKAVYENKNIYCKKLPSFDLIDKQYVNDRSLIYVINLPFINKKITRKNCIYIASNNGAGRKLYAKIDNGEIFFVKTLKHHSVIGGLFRIKNSTINFLNLIDNDSEIYIHSLDEVNEISESDFLIGKNLSMLGQEIIAYRFVTKISKNIYKLSRLIRGLYGTAKFTNEHVEGENFVILNQLDSIYIAEKLIGREICFFINQEIQSKITYNNLSNLVDKVKDIQYIKSDNFLEISFNHSHLICDDWQSVKNDFLYKITLENNGILYQYKTYKTEIKIHIPNISLSEDCKISIIFIRIEDSQESESEIINIL